MLYELCFSSSVASVVVKVKLVRVLDGCSLKELLSRGMALEKGHGAVEQHRPTYPLLSESVGIPETRYWPLSFLICSHRN